MATSHVSLEDVSFVLPNGEILFSHLNEHFDHRPTGLVGRNGSGKSVLARILAGQLQATQGRCVRAGTVHYLAQQVRLPDGTTVADLAGMRVVLDALQRIENGGCAQADFDAVGERWDAPAQLANSLAQAGLGHLDARTPAIALSGGEAMRVALVGAMLSDADFLILDEPSNHLDQASRQRLIEWVQQWRKGLLVISHDRQLLAHMTRIVELSSLGLRSHGGNYAFYAHSKAQEQQHALDELARTRLARRREDRALRDQRERQEKRQARATRNGKEANQAKILLDRQKERSDQTMGKLHRQQAQAQLELAQRVRHAAAQVAEDVHIHLHAPLRTGIAQQQVLVLDDVALPPFVPPPLRRISLQVTGQQRIGLIGPNGSGKSTLLKVIAGQLDAPVGERKVSGSVAYLDQKLAHLDAKRSAIAQLQDANPSLSEGELRMRLAQLGLDAQKAAAPTDALSGGERLKAALACVIYAAEPPQLLLLDEPSNHLDLPSLAALEALLTSHGGALIVASHDSAFLEQLQLTDTLNAGATGWDMQAVAAEP